MLDTFPFPFWPRFWTGKAFPFDFWSREAFPFPFLPRQVFPFPLRIPPPPNLLSSFSWRGSWRIPGGLSRAPVRGHPGQFQLRVRAKLLCFTMLSDTYLHHSHTKQQVATSNAVKRNVFCYFLVPDLPGPAQPAEPAQRSPRGLPDVSQMPPRCLPEP